MSEEEKNSVYKGLLSDTKKLYMQSRLGERAASNENIVGKIDDFYHRRFVDEKVLMEMVSDLSFLIPSLDYLAAASRRESCNSYFLYFHHFPYFMKGSYRGSPHALDLLYWFDIKVEDVEKLLNVGMQGEFAEEDIKLKRMFSSIIGDFVKTGNPGATLKTTIPSGWPKYDATNSYYLDFSPKPWVSSFLEKDKQDLWHNTVPGMTVKPYFHTEL